jgi:hypothetical protein
MNGTLSWLNASVLDGFNDLRSVRVDVPYLLCATLTQHRRCARTHSTSAGGIAHQRGWPLVRVSTRAAGIMIVSSANPRYRLRSCLSTTAGYRRALRSTFAHGTPSPAPLRN